MTDLRDTITVNPPSPKFLMTKEYRRFAEFCDACRRYRYIGLCYGPPGVGKTWAARHYARWHLIEGRDPVEEPAHRVPREIGTCRTLFYNAPVTNSPRVICQEMNESRITLRGLVGKASYDPNDSPSPVYEDACELIIVDEADRLKMTSLEYLRDLYDSESIGLILVGMPGLEKRLARYPQLYSRVGFAHAFRPLSRDEMRFILEHHWAELGLALHPQDFTDQEAVAAIIRITGGNFRLIHRLFTQMARIFQLNQMQTITQEVVEAARECLVIGTT